MSLSTLLDNTSSVHEYDSSGINRGGTLISLAPDVGVVDFSADSSVVWQDNIYCSLTEVRKYHICTSIFCKKEVYDSSRQFILFFIW